MLNVTGIVTTGGTEDTMIFTNLLAAQELSSRPGLVHIVQVSALTSAASAETIAREIQSALPSVEAKSRLQLSKSEADLIQQTGSLVAMIAVVAMGATALGVAATMTTGVLERRREIGIMKAVGAGRRKVASMFLAEASLVGAAGGLLGALAGLALGMIIEERVFGWPATFQPAVLPLTVALSILVAAAASALPIWRALGIGPASVLRGD
jgi:putative ABC transport system permease protein